MLSFVTGDAEFLLVKASRRAFGWMSVVWGVGLLLEAALRVPLVYLLPVDLMTGLSLMMLLAVIALLCGWTVCYAGRIQSRHANTTGALR